MMAVLFRLLNDAYLKVTLLEPYSVRLMMTVFRSGFASSGPSTEASITNWDSSDRTDVRGGGGLNARSLGARALST